MLTFERLRKINVRRCEEKFNHPLNSWSSAEWGNATAGECGEACNVAKKIIRIRDGMQAHNKGKTAEELKAMLLDEIADMIIYADLWAASEGGSLEDAIIKKFNEKSEEMGLDSDFNL